VDANCDLAAHAISRFSGHAYLDATGIYGDSFVDAHSHHRTHSHPYRPRQHADADRHTHPHRYSYLDAGSF
jgi:hypothetical protein